MKHFIISIAIILLSAGRLFPQNIEGIIAEVGNNNPTLIALRKSAEAEHIGNKTGLSLSNPELEFNYLWGNPKSIGKRNDFSVMQSFDFPAAYAYRNQISEYRNVQVELEFERHRREILLQARQLCNNLVYHNAMRAELEKRVMNARRIADSWEAKYEAGEVGIIDYNKSRVNLLNIERDAESNEIEREALLAELVSLNGGNPVDLTDTLFPLQAIPSEFEEWYAWAEQNSSLLQWLMQEVSVSLKKEQLSVALGLPRFQAGYMSETVVGEQYRGISFGIAIPLLENRNAVKYARAKTLAVQSAETDARHQFYNNLKALHTKAISLQKNLNEYRENLLIYNSTELLMKALEHGEIPVTEYIYELTFYYESIDRLLGMEKDLNAVVIEMTSYK